MDLVERAAEVVTCASELVNGSAQDVDDDNSDSDDANEEIFDIVTTDEQMRGLLQNHDVVLKRSHITNIQRRALDSKCYSTTMPVVSEELITKAKQYLSSETKMDDLKNTCVPVLSIDCTFLNENYSSSGTQFKFLYSAVVFDGDLKTIPVAYMVSKGRESIETWNLFLKCIRATVDEDFMRLGSIISNNHGGIRAAVEPTFGYHWLAMCKETFTELK